MALPTPNPTNPNPDLAAQLTHLGMRALPAQLNDFLARATQARWSPRQLLEQLVEAEISERSRRSLERRLRLSGINNPWPTSTGVGPPRSNAT